MKIKAILIFILLISPSALAFKHFGFKEYGIAILPDAKCIEKATLLNKELSRKLSNFPNPVNQWHITLYQGAYGHDDIKQITQKIKKLSIPQFDISFNKIYSSSGRWIIYGVDNSQELQKLHEDVVSFAVKYHKHPIVRAKEIYDNSPREKKVEIDTYGTTEVMDNFKPHMTLFYKYPADPALEQASNEIMNLVESSFTCKAEQIALGEVGYNGNMVRIIYTKNIPN